MISSIACEAGERFIGIAFFAYYFFNPASESTAEARRKDANREEASDGHIYDDADVTKLNFSNLPLPSRFHVELQCGLHHLDAAVNDSR
jgi:hypothetical protein